MARLIDADKLLSDNPVHVTGRILLPSGKSQNIDAIQVSAVNSAPTVDAAPVVRGEWKNVYKSGYKPNPENVCSECDCWSHRRSNFCPNCGAKMDVERGNDDA